MFVALEIADAFRVEETAFALTFAAITAACLAWTWWGQWAGRMVGPVLLILLTLMELVGILAIYPRPTDALVWADYVAFGLLSAAIIALSAMVLVSRRSAPQSPT